MSAVPPSTRGTGLTLGICRGLHALPQYPSTRVSDRPSSDGHPTRAFQRLTDELDHCWAHQALHPYSLLIALTEIRKEQRLDVFNGLQRLRGNLTQVALRKSVPELMSQLAPPSLCFHILSYHISMHPPDRDAELVVLQMPARQLCKVLHALLMGHAQRRTAVNLCAGRRPQFSLSASETLHASAGDRPARRRRYSAKSPAMAGGKREAAGRPSGLSCPRGPPLVPCLSPTPNRQACCGCCRRGRLLILFHPMKAFQHIRGSKRVRTSGPCQLPAGALRASLCAHKPDTFS